MEGLVAIEQYDAVLAAVVVAAGAAVVVVVVGATGAGATVVVGAIGVDPEQAGAGAPLQLP